MEEMYFEIVKNCTRLHFATFSHEWEFQHTTSSPLHSKSNGKAESAIKIARNLVKKARQGNKDLQMSLFEWRNTPDSNRLSPVQKLMSRRTRTTIPTTEALLKPEVIDFIYLFIYLFSQVIIVITENTVA